MASQILTVTSTSDDANDMGSLRYLLSQAQDGDTIQFDSSLANQAINLTNTLTVTKGVTIDGGTSGITINGQGNGGNFTNFTVATGSNTRQVTIENLKINNGSGKGTKGASGVSPNGDGGAGGDSAGGILLQSGHLTLLNDTFANDKATGGFGGKGAGSGAMGRAGNAAGAVYVEPGATVTASNLVFTGNSASSPGGGSYNDSNNDAVNAAAVCFVGGTRIRTARGEIAVEDLAVGDLVITAAGAHRPIRWIGHRAIDLAGNPETHRHRPVRVRAGAFGSGLPAHDLRLSPGHSVRASIVDDVLVPVGSLVNGATVVRELVDRVTYWHVELDSHDVILAEGLPCESFLDCGNRDALLEQEGIYDRTALPGTPADFCLPYVAEGLLVEALRHGLEARARRCGWRRGGLDPHLVVDGVRVEAQDDGDTLTFVFAPGARRAVLASATIAPSEHGPSLDRRRLGLSVSRIAIGGGLHTLHDLPAADPMLTPLFHPEEAEAGAHHRFTTGEAVLPPALWANCREVAVLRLTVDPTSGWLWIAPEAAEATPIDPPSENNVVVLRVA